MKRINMTKYGFVRCPEHDFVDDGNRFTCYYAGELRVSKLVADGQAYISGSSQVNNQLSYQEYSRLPHYSALDTLNGIPVTRLTDEMLEQLYNDCLAYVEEWKAFAAAVQYPDYDTIWCIVSRQHHAAVCRWAELQASCTLETIMKLSDYELRNFRDYVAKVKQECAYNPEERAKSLVGTLKSRELLTMTDEELTKPSYWYIKSMEYLRKV